MAPGSEELPLTVTDPVQASVQPQFESGRCYSNQELLSLRDDLCESDDDGKLSGGKSDRLQTPPGLPAATPPPTTERVPDVPIALQLGGGASNTALPLEENLKKKKKKSKAKKNKIPPPTGFEEFYADGPITPGDHEEEIDLYVLSRSFAERIETCIQRYRAKRKLDEVRAKIITKYLTLGGIDSSVTKAFTGGLDKDTLENSTAQEIAAIQATDYINSGSRNAKFYDPSNPDNWVVDFEGVAKGFLIPQNFGAENENDIKTYSAVIRNFLNYVLAHGVCKEYTNDVIAARKICDLAEKELWAIHQVRQRLPGDYNIAASTLYGGRSQCLHIGDQPWATDNPISNDYVATVPTFSDSEAERIFKTAVAFGGSDDLFLKIMKSNVHIVKTETKCFEIVGIERPDLKTMDEFAGVKTLRGASGCIKALGEVKFRNWEGPGLDEEDLTDDEDLKAKSVDTTVESFWLEDEILQHCFVGMKLELIVRELNVGLKFFDTIVGLYCSFHTVLPNEKMIFWKEPSPNTRPPPTEEEPDAEEKVMDALIEREVEESEN